ncbi:MAG: hypothetical protein ABH879_02500 [archaeon]
MRRMLVLAFALLILQPAYARELSLGKVADNMNPAVGDSIKVSLEFVNPFDQDIMVQIADKNVMAGSGVDIQCLEQNIPKGGVGMSYDPLQVLSEGEFNLGRARITYTNPDTGKEETIESNELEVRAEKGSAATQTTGITTIYQCNGQSIRSTSISSSGSTTSISIGGSQQQAQQQAQQQTQQNQQEMQDRLQNSQQNQDTGALKQQMEKQQAEQQQMMQELARSIEQDKGLQKMHEELTRQGYNLTQKHLNPASNNSGEFAYNYQKGAESGQISGRMDNGKLEDIQKITTEDIKKLLQEVSSNPDFQRFDDELRNGGFSQQQPQFSGSFNQSQLKIPYTNNNNTREITVDARNGNITKVSMEEETNWWKWSLIIPIIAAIAAYLLWPRRPGHGENMEEPAQEPIDYLAETRKMLEKAKQLFRNKKEKQAYAKVSEAVRFYNMHHLNTGELNRDDLVRELKERGLDTGRVEECLMLCDLVKFAKYKTNREDFYRIIGLSREIVK